MIYVNTLTIGKRFLESDSFHDYVLLSPPVITR
jgi:hypothetical protein